jgi:hypothetical protein
VFKMGSMRPLSLLRQTIWYGRTHKLIPSSCQICLKTCYGNELMYDVAIFDSTVLKLLLVATV